MTLRATDDHFVEMIGLPCSTLIWMSRGTTRRSIALPLGDPDHENTQKHNVIISRTTVFIISARPMFTHCLDRKTCALNLFPTCVLSCTCKDHPDHSAHHSQRGGVVARATLFFNSASHSSLSVAHASVHARSQPAKKCVCVCVCVNVCPSSRCMMCTPYFQL